MFAQGISGYEPARRDRRTRFEDLRTGDGRVLPDHLKGQISRELDRLELVLGQIKDIEARRDKVLVDDHADNAIARTTLPLLLNLKGIGSEFAYVLWAECFYRRFDNRRQVSAYAGLAPTPWQSGSIDHEQGVSKSGNPRLRTTMLQLAWLWLRHQPKSALTLWFHNRVKATGGSMRKSTIVALARKILVALWKYVSSGVVIEGAIITD